jgi:hypothetical protein
LKGVKVKDAVNGLFDELCFIHEDAVFFREAAV